MNEVKREKVSCAMVRHSFAFDNDKQFKGLIDKKFKFEKCKTEFVHAMHKAFWPFLNLKYLTVRHFKWLSSKKIEMF